MKISIFQKKILYSLKPGVSFLLPRTSFKVTLFPTRIEYEDLETDAKAVITWVTEGAVKSFKAELNLEKEQIEVSGKAPKGFYRFIVKEEKGSILFLCQRGPEKGFKISLTNNEESSKTQDNILLPKHSIPVFSSICVMATTAEKMSFGVHKALDVHKIEERKDLKEVIPIWFSLYQKIYSGKKSHREGLAKLLDFPEEKKALERVFDDLFEAGFSTFVPRLTDAFQGYLDQDETILQNASPLILLKEIGKKIRELFFVQEKAHFYLLPKLLQPFLCGRLLGIECTGYGKIDLEWSKRKLKKVIFYPDTLKTIHIYPSKEIKHFRFRRSFKDKGQKIFPGDPIIITDKKPLFFDRFEK